MLKQLCAEGGDEPGMLGRLIAAGSEPLGGFLEHDSTHLTRSWKELCSWPLAQELENLLLVQF